MAYFSALGHIIESSGGAEIISSADVLAQGSVRGFIRGNISIAAHESIRSSPLHYRFYISDTSSKCMDMELCLMNVLLC